VCEVHSCILQLYHAIKLRDKVVRQNCRCDILLMSHVQWLTIITVWCGVMALRRHRRRTNETIPLQIGPDYHCAMQWCLTLSAVKKIESANNATCMHVLNDRTAKWIAVCDIVTCRLCGEMRWSDADSALTESGGSRFTGALRIDRMRTYCTFRVTEEFIWLFVGRCCLQTRQKQVRGHRRDPADLLSQAYL